MTITITVKEAFERGIWEEVCELTGTNVWAVNEGLMEEDDTFDLTEEQAIKLRIISGSSETEPFTNRFARY